MSSNDFRCPACRAKQPLQPVCRRCDADLSLLVRATEHVAALIARHEQARAQADHHAMETTARQLALLAPKRLTAICPDKRDQ
ncbi:hypothetical protein Enr13x_05570 [Stieleria neptunia]|uniref:Uncharacterized protein n=1 Tax=Stieleria neptunia TaxID=2527979 RepID=A0A518HIN6_9BACT|nr:hypothetical protein [Stieleria neptunia]QDV40721.1 hypothetical protein Enr13x_05570 [Stieleria neptunia]